MVAVAIHDFGDSLVSAVHRARDERDGSSILVQSEAVVWS